MLRYTLKRLAVGLATVYFIATATFAAMHLVPGDPISGAKAMRPEIRANLEKRYGLDRPLAVQYGVFLRNMLKGDFGISFTQQNRSVNDIIREHFPVSAVLGVLAILVAGVGGILFGSLTALLRGKFADRTVMFLVILGISVPSFVFAALGQYLVTLANARAGTTLLPVAGWGTFRHMLLPALVLGLGTMAFLTRLMRSSLLEIVHLDYVRTARAKGVRDTLVVLHHALRNAVLPVLTISGVLFGFLLSASVAVEQAFAVSGLGTALVQAFQERDLLVVQTLVLLYGVVFVVVNLLIDLAYVWVDPRIRYT